MTMTVFLPVQQLWQFAEVFGGKDGGEGV